MDRQKRILYIVHDGQLYGSQYSLLLILKSLATEKYSAWVSLARKGPLSDRLEHTSGVQCLFHKRLAWVKHDKRSPLQHCGDLLGLLLSLPGRVLALVQVIKKHQIDLVHTNSVVSLEGALAAKLAGVPHIWHIRELFMFPSPKFHLTLGRSLSRWIMAHCSQRVICISQAVRQQFGPYLQSRPEQFLLIYNALDQESQSVALARTYPLNSGQIVLGYMGRLSAGKRFHDLLAAFLLLQSDIRHSGLNLSLRVAGSFVDEAYQNRILRQVESEGLSDCVTFLGYQDQPQDFFNTIDVLVVPSLNEPFGRVVIEAMAAGVPCLGAESGGIPEIITHGENGWLFAPENPQVLALQLKTLITATGGFEHIALRIAQNALRTVEKRFSIESQRQAIETCYQRLLASGD